MKSIFSHAHSCVSSHMRRILTVWVLILSFALSTFLGVVPSAAENDAMLLSDSPEGLADNTYDLIIPQGEVVASLLGEIGEAESVYLNTHSQYALMVSAVPKEQMLVHVSDDGLTVIAYAYSSTVEGTSVTWIPFAAENTTRSAEICLLDYDADFDLYRGELAGSKGDTVMIYYTASVVLSRESALSMINEAYLAAERLSASMQDYEEQYALWLSLQEKYTAFLSALTAWEQQNALYDAYCEAQNAFDAWWQDHDEKEAAMNAYLAQKAAFEAWEQYQKDLSDYEAYMELVHASPELKETYETQMKLVLSQLSLMERMFLQSDSSSSRASSIVDVLNSGAVNFILSNATTLKNIDGVDPADVDRSVSATWALRRLLTGKQDEEGNLLVPGYQHQTTHEAQYAFYVANREELLYQLNELYNGMLALGEVEYVQKELNERGALATYKNFMANLYVQSRLMDDTQVLDAEVLHLGDSLQELLDEDMIWEDAFVLEPLESYPMLPFTSDDVPAVEYPGEAPPQAEDPGDEPAPVPNPDDAPDEPTPIDPPGDRPEAVADPGTPPSAPSMTDAERGLYEAYVNDALLWRTEDALVNGTTAYITQKCAANAVSGKRFTVKMMNHEGVVQQTRNLAFGTRLEDAFTPPAVKTYDGTIYTFVGWSLQKTPLPQNKDQKFHTIDIEDVVTSMELYPVYVMCHQPGDAATCTKDQVCTACGEVLNPMLGHAYTTEVTPPTCTEGGYTTHTCTRCGDSYTDTPTDPLDHTEGDAATCTKDQVCTVCGEVLNPMLGHAYTSEVTSPTCTESGYTTHTCTRCGDSYTDTPTALAEHTYGEWVTDVPPEPGREGHKYAECQFCGERKEETIEALPPTSESTQPDSEETQTDPEETQTDPEETQTDPEETQTDPEETQTDPDESETSGEDSVTEPEQTTDGEDPSEGSDAVTDAETKGDGAAATILQTPEVKWYAKILGAVGLPGLVVLSGMIVGGGAAGVVILVMRGTRHKRKKR